TQPEKALQTPGFNCSGFVVAAAARLAGRNFDLTAVSRDRRGDSSPGAALGQDWDFGLDLILNLTEDLPRRFLPPINEALAPPLFAYAPGLAAGLGVDLHSPLFEKHLHELQPGRFAFFVFSKPDRRFPAGVSYYHVGLIIPESPEAIWLYHSTAGARTHRFNLAAAGDLARLRRYFPPTKSGERRVLMIEAAPEDGCP
ncbi:MAG: hypothetical protein LBS31_06585, partial [Candidatus Adiutrix sp.]|nr:hypothetical protein [Candidatus Adiutrix sp.]